MIIGHCRSWSQPIPDRTDHPQPDRAEPSPWVLATESALRRAGGRSTRSRRGILLALDSAPEGLSGEELLAALDHADLQTARSTVYRTLDTLRRIGAVDTVHPAPSTIVICPAAPAINTISSANPAARSPSLTAATSKPTSSPPPAPPAFSSVGTPSRYSAPAGTAHRPGAAPAPEPALRPGPYEWTTTLVFTSQKCHAQRESSSRRFTQPWLCGAPNSSCQYA